MTKGKKKGKKIPEAAKLLSEKTLAEQLGYFTIVLEDVRGQVQTLAEGQVQLLDELKQEIAEARAEAKQDNRFLQQALKATRADLIEKIDSKVDGKIDGLRVELKEEIQGVRVELKEVERRLSEKIDRGGAILENHEVRITSLEQRA